MGLKLRLKPLDTFLQGLQNVIQGNRSTGGQLGTARFKSLNPSRQGTIMFRGLVHRQKIGPAT
jgi:hypothetical protein